MTKKEAVLLVSRALAIIQIVTALEAITYLPERFISLFHHAQAESVLEPFKIDRYFQTLDRVGMTLMLVRILGLLVLAFIFWNCGPWVERILLPRQENTDPSA